MALLVWLAGSSSVWGMGLTFLTPSKSLLAAASDRDALQKRVTNFFKRVRRATDDLIRQVQRVWHLEEIAAIKVYQYGVSIPGTFDIETNPCYYGEDLDACIDGSYTRPANELHELLVATLGDEWLAQKSRLAVLLLDRVRDFGVHSLLTHFADESYSVRPCDGEKAAPDGSERARCPGAQVRPRSDLRPILIHFRWLSGLNLSCESPPFEPSSLQLTFPSHHCGGGALLLALRTQRARRSLTPTLSQGPRQSLPRLSVHAVGACGVARIRAAGGSG